MSVGLVFAVGISLAACAENRNDVVPAPIPTVNESASPDAGPSAEPKPDPTMSAGASALENFQYFNFINERLLAVNTNPSDVAIVSNLEKAGFVKADIEVTPDKTSELRRPSDSIEVTVRIGADCLIGQYTSSGYFSIVGPVLNGNKCLVGKTERIP